MAIIRVGCIRFHGLELSSKQDLLLNDFRSLGLDVINTKEISVSNMRTLCLYLTIYASQARLAIEGGLAVLYRKGLDPNVRMILLDLG